jgi:hypothetical protein
MMMGKHRCGVHKLSIILLVIGGLNWGLISIDPSWNLVGMLFGAWPMVVRVVYALVGLAALSKIAHMFGMCGSCNKMMSDCKDGTCEMHGGAKGPAMQGKM